MKETYLDMLVDKCMEPVEDIWGKLGLNKRDAEYFAPALLFPTIATLSGFVYFSVLGAVAGIKYLAEHPDVLQKVGNYLGF